MTPKFWKGAMSATIILLLVVILLLFTLDDAEANNPKLKYHEQQKYAWIFCRLAGIPKNRCHGKKP
jgi:hypothetical protein